VFYCVSRRKQQVSSRSEATGARTRQSDPLVSQVTNQTSYVKLRTICTKQPRKFIGNWAPLQQLKQVTALASFSTTTHPFWLFQVSTVFCLSRGSERWKKLKKKKKNQGNWASNRSRRADTVVFSAETQDLLLESYSSQFYSAFLSDNAEIFSSIVGRQQARN
jgi:hypothetical protein